jgi:hypothetical protein
MLQHYEYSPSSILSAPKSGLQSKSSQVEGHLNQNNKCAGKEIIVTKSINSKTKSPSIQVSGDLK